MLIVGIPLSLFTAYAEAISSSLYSGNVIVHPDAHDIPNNGSAWTRSGYPKPPRCQARLAVRDSRGPGSRTAANGRHGPYACWHAYRDVLELAFFRYPDAVITAGHAWRIVYRGEAGFQELYPETARKNIGSRLRPVTMPELCNCLEDRAPATRRDPGASRRFSPWVPGYDSNGRLDPPHTGTRPATSVHGAATCECTLCRNIARLRQERERLTRGAMHNRYCDCSSCCSLREARRSQVAADYPAEGAGPFSPRTAAQSDANYVSPAVQEAGTRLAESAEILDRWDETVFGPYYDQRDDPRRHRDSY